jgi:hypothetical protein
VRYAVWADSEDVDKFDKVDPGMPAEHRTGLQRA